MINTHLYTINEPGKARSYMHTFQDTLVLNAKLLNIELSFEQIEAFNLYLAQLLEYNQKVNLTAITDPCEIAVKHFADSLSLLSALNIPQNASLIDVGTGAGFPSVPLKIVRNDLNITLLDSLNKRLVFLSQLLESLNISAPLIHSRAEEAARLQEYREKYDFATARAVAPLPVLCEYCLPFVKVGGYFLAMKGPNCELEIENSNKTISVLGGSLINVFSFNLGEDNQRKVIIIKKISQTPTKYPRHSSKIGKDTI